MDRIEGSVARILNSRELVLNRGSEHGVVVGMQFAVLNSQGGGITDPETGEPLGSVEVPKVIVKIVQVYEKMSVASTFRQYRTSGGALGSPALGDLLGGLYARPETRTETLKTTDTTYREELSSSDSYVKSGDRSVQVIGEEFAGWTANR